MPGQASSIGFRQSGDTVQGMNSSDLERLVARFPRGNGQEEIDRVWVEASAGLLIRHAVRAGLKPADARLNIAVGRGEPPLVLMRRNHRAVRDLELDDQGTRVLEAMKQHIWHDEDGNWGPYDSVVQRSPFRGWHFFAGAGPVVGVLQLRTMDRHELTMITNLWVPSLTTWRKNKELRELSTASALEVMETYDVLKRIDGMEHDIAIQAALRL